MKNKKIALACLLMPLLFTLKSQAQNDMGNDSKKTERIIITQKNGTIDSMTIEVNGDHITINGKPASDNKDIDITILKDADDDEFKFAPGFPGMAFGDRDGKGKGDFFYNNGNSSQAFLGVMSEKNKDGARITDVTDESGADSAGLKAGDIITKVGDTRIGGPSDLSEAIKKNKPNDKVMITYMRDGKTFNTTATLHSNGMRIFAWKDLNNIKGFSMPSTPNMEKLVFGFNRSTIKLGAQVQDMDDNSGVKILNIEKEGAVAKAGLQSNDVITKINDTKITSVDDIRDLLKYIREGDTIQLTYSRNNSSKTVSIKFPKELKTMNL
ncbi:MAG: PDZ domain-containing protein [Bacteroidetes bacterium]|nr:PDZ domain-containing protein [Bacteroidota bacterium]